MSKEQRVAKNARERMTDILTANGWSPDTTRTYVVGGYRYGTTDDRERRQHPGYWVKPAESGGVWLLYMDYEVPNGYSTKFDNRLRRANITYYPEGLENKHDGMYMLSPPGRSRYYRYRPDPLFAILGKGNDEASLRERVEALVVNVELALWLAAEEAHRRSVAAHKAAEDRVADRELRAKWEQSTLTREEFRTLAQRLSNTHLTLADGKTDLAAELARVRTALEAMEGSLIRPETDYEAGALIQGALA